MMGASKRHTSRLPSSAFMKTRFCDLSTLSSFPCTLFGGGVARRGLGGGSVRGGGDEPRQEDRDPATGARPESPHGSPPRWNKGGTDPHRRSLPPTGPGGAPRARSQ